MRPLSDSITVGAAAAILLCSAILFSPTRTFAQETQLTLHLENKTLIEVMSAIEKKSDYKFYYNTNVLDLKRRVNIEVVNETIPVVLEKLFASTKISYQINGRDVVLTVPGAEPAKRPAAEANFVKGTVYDRNGNPLIGASIILEGTTSGTTTGSDGMYAIRVSKQMVRLTVSFLGYVSQQVPAISGTIVDVVLQEDDTMMEDVVIVGYGSQKKANLTGAVAEVSFNNDATKSRPLTNMSTALSGMIPGLRVQQGSGTPGCRQRIAQSTRRRHAQRKRSLRFDRRNARRPQPDQPQRRRFGNGPERCCFVRDLRIEGRERRNPRHNEGRRLSQRHPGRI